MSRRAVGSIQWRSPGVARIELQHGFDPVTGKPLRMSRTIHGNEQDAERVLAAMLLEIGRLPTGGNMTLYDYIENVYKPALQARVRKETRHGYESKLDKHVLPQLGHLKLGNLEPYLLDRWRDNLTATMSGRSALHVYRVLSAALNRAVRWRLLPANPLAAVDPPRARVRDLDTLDATQVLAYLKHFQGHTCEAVVIMALATGMRPSELYALTWANVDLAQAEVRVTRGLHQRNSDVWFEPTKSERSNRVVSLPEWAVTALKPLRGLGALTPDADGYSGHMRPHRVAKLYAQHVRKGKLRYVPLRDLRHTHATLMLEAGVDVVVVSRRLGHSTVAITDAHYLRPRRSADRKAADALGDLLAGHGVSAGLGVINTNANE